MPSSFSYSPVAGASGGPFLAPLLPLGLRFGGGEIVRTHGLLDSGAAVNVLPFGLGIRLGVDWRTQTTSVTLTGNLAKHEARAVIIEAKVAEFMPVRLVFAWSRSDDVPLILGQVN